MTPILRSKSESEKDRMVYGTYLKPEAKFDFQYPFPGTRKGHEMTDVEWMSYSTAKNLPVQEKVDKVLPTQHKLSFPLEKESKVFQMISLRLPSTYVLQHGTHPSQPKNYHSKPIKDIYGDGSDEKNA